MTPDHDGGRITFRVTNVGGFGVLNTTYRAAQVTQALMDELAKKTGRPGQLLRLKKPVSYNVGLAGRPLVCLQLRQLVGVPKMFHLRLRSQNCETR
jgi:hypothetical protein